MLRKIYNAIKAIGEFISAVVGFVRFLIESLINFFKLIPKAIEFLFNSIGWIPSSLLILLTAVVTVLVIRKIIGR